MINLLHGCTFEFAERFAVRRDSAVAELMKIGHTNTSETFAPQVEDAAASLGAGFAYADCPGFLDNRGFEINVANAVNVKQMAVAAASVSVAGLRDSGGGRTVFRPCCVCFPFCLVLSSRGCMHMLCSAV